MSYRWIFFDADGTLFDYDAAERSSLRAALDERGILICPEHLGAYREINSELWERFESGQIEQKELRVLRFSRMFERFGWSLDPAAFGDAYLHHLAESAQLIEDADTVISSLMGMVKLLLLTNGIPEVQRSRLERSPFRAMFDHVVISGDVGVAKPDPRIFEAAVREAGNPPISEVLMVGDSLSSDMEGADRYGIDSCWFNPSGRRNPTQLCPTFEIKDLRELLAIVKT